MFSRGHAYAICTSEASWMLTAAPTNSSSLRHRREWDLPLNWNTQIWGMSQARRSEIAASFPVLAPRSRRLWAHGADGRPLICAARGRPRPPHQRLGVTAVGPVSGSRWPLKQGPLGGVPPAPPRGRQAGCWENAGSVTTELHVRRCLWRVYQENRPRDLVVQW